MLLHSSGESQDFKEPIQAANETTEGDTTTQPETDNKEVSEEKEVELTDPETVGSGEEPVKDKKEEPVTTEIKQTNASRPGTDKSTTDAEKV